MRRCTCPTARTRSTGSRPACWLSEAPSLSVIPSDSCLAPLGEGSPALVLPSQRAELVGSGSRNAGGSDGCHRRIPGIGGRRADFTSCAGPGRTSLQAGIASVGRIQAGLGFQRHRHHPRHPGLHELSPHNHWVWAFMGPGLTRRGPAVRGFQQVMIFLTRTTPRMYIRFQNGDLRRYITVTVLAAMTLVGMALIRSGATDFSDSWMAPTWALST